MNDCTDQLALSPLHRNSLAIGELARSGDAQSPFGKIHDRRFKRLIAGSRQFDGSGYGKPFQFSAIGVCFGCHGHSMTGATARQKYFGYGKGPGHKMRVKDRPYQS